MNKEVIKAMNKTQKKSHFQTVLKWWRKNNYKVWRIVLFPIWFYEIASEKIHAEINARVVWSEARAQEILNYYIPRRAEWDEKNKSFYFFDNGMGWEGHGQKCVKAKDRRFWKKYVLAWGGEIRNYLIHNFELEGFQKIIGDCYDGRTDIEFKMIEK